MATHAPVKVTVLMTLYNKGPFVGEAARSILANTFTDMELLVVDDASTDGGPDEVRAIGDPRVRLLENERNTGRPAAANRGLEAARGEYIAILDADDIADPERLAKQVAFLDANPGIGACGTALRTFGHTDSIIQHPLTDAEARVQVFFSVPMAYPATMLRRSVIEQHRIRCDETWLRPGMDLLFLVDLTAHTRIANLPEALVSYRIGEQNMRHGRDPVEDFIHIDREVFRLVGLPITNAQLDVHVHLHRPFVQRLTAARVRALRAWMKAFARMNRERNAFPAEELERAMEVRWSTIFFPLADADAWAAITHLRCSGSAPWARVSYLLKTTMGRWLGRRKA